MISDLNPSTAFAGSNDNEAFCKNASSPLK
jgi:hypothetical protein